MKYYLSDVNSGLLKELAENTYPTKCNNQVYIVEDINKELFEAFAASSKTPILPVRGYEAMNMIDSYV